MKKKAYRSLSVKGVVWQEVCAGREGEALDVGVDVGKY